MKNTRLALVVPAAVVLCLAGAALLAQGVGRPSLERLKSMIVSRQPQTRVTKVDQERLIVRRIDVVDEEGTIRMTLASPTPQPVVDGIQYRRTFPVSGVTFFDRAGSERGGIGVADIEGSAVVLAQDHANGDAVGWRVMPDGAVSFAINERAPLLREPALDGKLIPGVRSPTRISMAVAADGTPSIALADGQDRPRLRLTVNEQGFGAIEFLDAHGKVVEALVPEAGMRH